MTDNKYEITEEEIAERIKQMKRDQNKRYREKHPDKVRKNTIKWQKKNAEHMREYRREYYAKNKEVIRQRQNNWYRKKAIERIEEERRAAEENK